MLPLLLTAALLMLPDIDPPSQYKAWIQDHQVWMQTSAGDRRVTYDELAAEPVAGSPNGDRVVYGVINPNFDAEHCGNTPRKYVVLVDGFGRRLWKVGLEFACEDFDKFEWIDDHRIGVMLCGRVNCIYWVLDASSGRILQELSGGSDFLWSHDRRYVARRRMRGITREDDRGASFESDELSALSFNDDDKEVYPPEDPKTQRPYERILGYLTWSPTDAWVSFPEVEYPTGDSYVVLVSPHGEVMRESLPVDVEYNANIEWTDNIHFQVPASKHMFKFVVDKSGLREIVDHSK